MLKCKYINRGVHTQSTLLGIRLGFGFRFRFGVRGLDFPSG